MLGSFSPGSLLISRDDAQLPQRGAAKAEAEPVPIHILRGLRTRNLGVYDNPGPLI